LTLQRLLARAEEAIGVVDAFLAALPADELGWIEWKGSLDLSSKAVRGILARHILGMANRMPETAASHAGGRAFIVVGRSPGTAAASRQPIRRTCPRASTRSLGPSGRCGRCTTTTAVACRSSC